MKPDNLESWLGYLETLHPVEIDLGLDRVSDVADSMGLLSPAAKIITVAGTNGKGSTCALLSAMLLAAGYHVGVYSSPHLLRYNERVVIDGEQVSDELLVNSFSRIEAARGSTSLSYFEFATLAALDIFNRRAVDVMVLEVGLGGRLDAVNILNADVSVVTTIAIDHEQWLGSNVDLIGKEKAGIFRADRPAIYGDACVNHGVANRAGEIGALLFQRGTDYDLELSADHWGFRSFDSKGSPLRYDQLPLPLLPVDNAATALFALQQLSVDVPIKAIHDGLRSASLMGRYQICSMSNKAGHLIDVILDVAHNPQSAAYLGEKLQASTCTGKTHCVLAMLSDKDIGGVLNELNSHFTQWFVTECVTPRACSVTRLQEELLQMGCEFVTTCSSVAEALARALDASEPIDRIVVAGSFYTVADALTEIELSNANNGG